MDQEPGEASIDEILAMADVPFLKAVVARYPETVLLAGLAEASPEGNPRLKPGSLAVRVFDFVPVEETAIEAERTFLALLLFKATLNGEKSFYPHLSQDSFTRLCRFTSAHVTTAADREFVLYSLACNDLGKTQAMIDRNIALRGRKAPDHDRLMAELVCDAPGLFPGFGRLTPAQQNLYRAGLDTNFNLGQMVQGEALPADLADIQAIGERARTLRLVAEFYDFAGATGHVRNDVSILLTEDNLWAYMTAIDELTRLPLDRAYQRFIALRAAKAGILPHEPDAFALSRIAVLSRSFTPEKGDAIRAVWRALPDDVHGVLTRELNETGSCERPGIALLYAPSIIANATACSGSFHEGLRYALLCLAHQFETARATIDLEFSEPVLPVNLVIFARLAAQDAASIALPAPSS